MSLTSTLRGILGTDVDTRVAEALSEVAAGNDARVVEVLSDMTKVVGQNGLLEERISELENFIEDVGWERIYGYNGDFQFTREALRDIIRLSRLMYLKNPIIRRPVDLQAYYVWGQGYEIKADKNSALNDVVQRFIDDPSNQRALTGSEACLDAERKLRVEGNLFLGFYVNLSSGRVQVRRFKVDKMAGIVYDDDDDTVPHFYLREWSTSNGAQRRYYPDWNYVRLLRAKREAGLLAGETDQLSEPMYRDVGIDWDVPVLHRKTGGFSDMDFGVPETYPALDWARAYKEVLEDYKKTVKALAKWAMVLKKEGATQAQISAIQARLQSTLGTTSQETNPAPVTGSTFVANDSIDLKALDVSKAAVDPDKFNRIMLMACAAMGTPSNFYGDAASGNLASAKTLDRPTELMFRSRQNLWSEVFSDCCTVAIEAAALAPRSKKVTSAGYDEDTGLMKIKADRKLVEINIDMNFPPVLQQDVQSVVQSLVTGITLNGQPIQVMNDGPTILRILLKALGIDEVDEVVEIFYPKDGGKSTAKPIETYAKPAAPGEKPVPAAGPNSPVLPGTDGATLTPAQQAAQQNQKVKSPHIDAPPQSPAQKG